MNVLNMLSRVARRFRLFLHKPDVEQELTDEVRLHVDLEAEDLVRRGWRRTDAHREALQRLGGMEQTKERVREGRPLRWLDDLLQDLRYAGRSMRRQPAVFVAAVLILASGIGANTALFSVVQTVLFRPLPYADSDDLAVVWRENPVTGDRSGVSPVEFRALQDDFESAASASLFMSATEIVYRSEEPFEVEVGILSAGFFQALGVKPLRGRDMTLEDADPGNPLVIILSHRLWQERFGGAAEVLGSTLRVGNSSFTVVGIMGADFTFPQVFGSGPRFDLWRPFPEAEGPSRFGRAGVELHSIVRLEPGTTHEAARAELAVLDARFAADRPAAFQDQILTLVGLKEQIAGEVRPVLIMLWAAVTAVLLIVCANVANLLLTRATVRQHEFAIRASLGAGRWRLIRQTLTESVVLAACGGAIGLALAAAFVRVLPLIDMPGVPRLAEMNDPFGLAPLVVVFSVGLTLGTGLVFGLAPALRIANAMPQQQLQASGRTTDGRRSQALRAALVVAQVSCAVMLLTTAGLMIRSSLILLNAGPGFDSRNLLTLRVVLPRSQYLPRDAVFTRADGFFSQLTTDIEGLAEVERVTHISHLPLSGRSATFPYQVPEHPALHSAQTPVAEFRSVAPGFFRALKLPLLAGRDFDARDTAESPPIAIVNEAFVRVNWPGEDPIGKRIERNGWPDPYTVVGLAPDISHETLDGPVSPMLYLPLAQDRATTMSVVVRTIGNPMSVVGPIRQRVSALEPAAIVLDVQPMDALVSTALGARRVATRLLGVFAGLALCLAAFGIYSVVSYTVVQRTSEIGLRVALGARPGQILALVLKQGVLLAAGGIALGFPGALVASNLLASLLFGVTPTDGLTLVTVCATLVTIAILATYFPTRRAMRIDPAVALRHE